MQIQVGIESAQDNKEYRGVLIISSRNSYSGFDECHRATALQSSGPAV